MYVKTESSRHIQRVYWAFCLRVKQTRKKVQLISDIIIIMYLFNHVFFVRIHSWFEFYFYAVLLIVFVKTAHIMECQEEQNHIIMELHD